MRRDEPYSQEDHDEIVEGFGVAMALMALCAALALIPLIVSCVFGG